jgi:hypothetical protein
MKPFTTLVTTVFYPTNYNYLAYGDPLPKTYYDYLDDTRGEQFSIGASEMETWF